MNITISVVRPLLRALLPISIFALVAGCGSSSSDSDGDFVYVALGASDATGIGATPLSNGYVFRIDDGLEVRGLESSLVNLGLPGAEADDIEDATLDIATELTDADLVTIFTGGNDLVGGRGVAEFESDLMDIFGELRQEAPDAIIVVANLPDLTQLPRFQEEPDSDVTAARVAEFNQAITRQAAVYAIPVVDLASRPVEEFLVSDDGFHPSDAGHQLIADLFLQVIDRQLMNRPGSGDNPAS